jgi:hypothetical protein
MTEARGMGRKAMRMHGPVALALLAMLSGCASERTPRDERGREAVGAEGASTETQEKQPITRNYDAQGRLLPSDDYIAGIRLPRGAKLFREDELHHVYRIQAPIEKVLAYFGPMMITGNVERRGKGAIYKQASVRGAEINPTKVDVSILEVGSSMTRISVTELRPPSDYVPSSDQTKAAAREDWRRLD